MPVLSMTYTPDIDALCTAARISDPADRARFAVLLACAQKRPGKAVYAAPPVSANHAAFPSNLFREGAAVYPFVVTCGPDMEAFGETLDDPLEQFWWDVIMLDAVTQGYKALKKEIESVAGRPLTAVSPGITDDWPLGGQPALFALIGGVEAAVGVTLSNSHIMHPIKSLSGVFRESEPGDEDML